MEKLWTVKELAARLNVNPGSVYHWLSAEEEWIAKFTIRLGSRCIRFQPSVVEAAMKELTRSAVQSADQRQRKSV